MATPSCDPRAQSARERDEVIVTGSRDEIPDGGAEEVALAVSRVREAIVFRAPATASRVSFSTFSPGGATTRRDATRRHATRRHASRCPVAAEGSGEEPREEEAVAAGKHVTLAQRRQREETVHRAPAKTTDRRRCQISPRARHEHGLVYEEVLEAP